MSTTSAYGCFTKWCEKEALSLRANVESGNVEAIEARIARARRQYSDRMDWRHAIMRYGKMHQLFSKAYETLGEEKALVLFNYLTKKWGWAEMGTLLTNLLPRGAPRNLVNVVKDRFIALYKPADGGDLNHPTVIWQAVMASALRGNAAEMGSLLALLTLVLERAERDWQCPQLDQATVDRIKPELARSIATYYRSIEVHRMYMAQAAV